MTDYDDRRKDSLAQLAGIKIMRFTGSEIFHGPARCAALVLKGLAA